MLSSKVTPIHLIVNMGVGSNSLAKWTFQLACVRASLSSVIERSYWVKIRRRKKKKEEEEGKEGAHSFDTIAVKTCLKPTWTFGAVAQGRQTAVGPFLSPLQTLVIGPGRCGTCRCQCWLWITRSFVLFQTKMPYGAANFGPVDIWGKITREDTILSVYHLSGVASREFSPREYDILVCLFSSSPSSSSSSSSSSTTSWPCSS